MPEGSAELAALAEEFYSVWFRCRPDVALAAGITGYEGLLPVQDEDDLSALAGWLETLVLALEDIDLASLRPQDRLDWLLMHTGARFEHDELRRGDRLLRDPSAVLPVGEIYRLTLAAPQRIRERLGCLLAEVPEYLRHAQGHLRAAAADLPPVLVRAAAREADGGRCYIRELVGDSWLRRQVEDLSDLESRAVAACDALTDYRAFMLSGLLPEAAGALGCGTDQLGARLAGVHFLDCDPSSLGPVLEAAEADNESALGELARTAAEPVRTLLEHAAREVSGGDAWVKAHAELCDAVAGELVGAGLVDLPAADLHLGLRPACPQPQGFRADYIPDGATSGTLFLTASGGARASGEPVESIRERCLDQGWGGSHLLAFGAPDCSRRLPRLAADACSLTTGWGLYLGHRLARACAAPLERQAWTLARRRREIRVARLDLAIHCEGLDEAGAMARLGDAGLGEAAETVLVRLVSRPGEALAGVLGWLLIEEARRLAEAGAGRGFDQRGFHHKVLAQGGIPMSLALCFGLGEPLWRAVRERVLPA